MTDRNETDAALGKRAAETAGMSGREMKLSRRLKMVASFVPRGSRVADVGTDHGYVPIYLTGRGIASGAVAMDVRKGPLKRAKAHVIEAGLKPLIEVRLSDGLKELEPGEADCVIIAGMGGDLMIHIIEEGRRLWEDIKYWILSPQSRQEGVRRYLLGEGFRFCRERMLKEDGKFYTVMGVTRSGGPGKTEEGEGGDGTGGGVALKAFHYRYGYIPIRDRDLVLSEFLRTEERKLKQIMKTLERSKTPAAVMRYQELKGELLQNKEAQDEMQRSDTGA